MSACDDGHTTQPCPGCGTCIRWQTSYGTTPKTAGWVEHDGSAHHCRAASNVAALVDAARGAEGWRHAALCGAYEVGNPLAACDCGLTTLRTALARVP